ncbi:MAG: hypothetical protein IPH22_02175 [Nitrosomonas sp.]|nr:hypothetical protein [Nitrosomonas sp.]
MATLKQRLDLLEQRRHKVSAYPEGWPVLVPDYYTDEQIEILKVEIGRVDIYRENDPAWAEIFI